MIYKEIELRKLLRGPDFAHPCSRGMVWYTGFEKTKNVKDSI